MLYDDHDDELLDDQIHEADLHEDEVVVEVHDELYGLQQTNLKTIEQ
jgi:hypothetical protein